MKNERITCRNVRDVCTLYSFLYKMGKTGSGAVCRHLTVRQLRPERYRCNCFPARIADSINKVYAFIEQNNRLPDVIAVGNKRVSPDDYFTCMARTVIELIKTSELPILFDFLQALTRSDPMWMKIWQLRDGAEL